MTYPSVGQRPTTITQMKECLSHLMTEESLRYGLAIQPKSTDVIISSHGKSGTTWIQQIVHGLRTQGSMDFDEIMRVIPWLEMAFEVGIELESPQVAEPRAFKSHLNWDKVPKGGRHIYAIRNPKDVLVSVYYFLEGWWFEPGSISISDLAEASFIGRTVPDKYWDHVASWWKHRHDPNILILCFEDMKADLPGTIRTIAQFIGCELDDELLDIVVRQSSLEFMLAYKEQFDEHLMREVRNPVCGLPAGGDSSKVRKGEVNSHHDELPEKVSKKLDVIWREEMELKLGLASYQALRDELAHQK